MKYKIECTYCGITWIEQRRPKTCIRCLDKKLKAKEIDSTNVFGYPEDPEEDEMDDWS